MSAHRAQKRSGKRTAARKRPRAANRLDLATRAINEGVYDWDIARGRTVYSDRVTSALGLTRRTPEDWYRRIHPDDRPRYDAALVDHFKGRTERFECDYRYRTGDGGWRWARQHGIAQRDARGRAVRMIGSTGDITELKLAEIELRRARDEAEQALEQHKATSEILASISGSMADTQPVFDVIVRNLLRLFGTRYAGVFLRKRDRIEVAALRGDPGFERIREAYPLPLDDNSVGGRAILSGRVQQFTPVLDNPEVPPGTVDLARNYGFNSLLTAPLARDGRVIGYVATAHRDARPFDDKQVALIKTFADQAMIAIENARLFNETREALQQQTATSEILRVISSSPTDVQPVFDAIVASGLKLFEGAAISVSLPDGDQVRLAAIAAVDGEQAALWRGAFPFGLTRQRVHGIAMLDRRLVDIADVQISTEFPEEGRNAFLSTGNRAISVIPMLRDDTAIGAISVIRKRPGALSERQCALLKTFADQASIAIENVRLFNETKEALEQQTAIGEILRVISSSPVDVQPVFNAIVRSAVTLCGSTNGAVFRYDGELLHYVAGHNFTPQWLEAVRAKYPLRADRSTISGRAVLTRTVAHIEDVLADPAYDNAHAIQGGWRRMLATPLLRDGAALGAIVVAWAEPGSTPKSQQELLKTFAEQAVVAIENVRLFNETREALDRQTATAEILKVIASSPGDVQPVFDAIVQSAVRLCQSRYCIVWSVEGQKLRIAAHAGVSAAGLRELSERYPAPLSAPFNSVRCARERAVIRLTDAQTNPNIGEAQRRIARLEGYQSQVWVPMVRDERCLGVIGLTRPENEPYPESQIALLKTFADQAVIAIENVRLFNETKEALEQQKASGEVLEAISSSIADAKPVFERILKSCERLFQGHAVAIGLAEPDGFLHLAAFHGRTQGEFEAIFPVPLTGESATGQAFQTRSVVHYPDALHGSDVPPYGRRAAESLRVRATMVAPMLWEGQGVGGILVGRETPGPFSEKEISLLKTFADQAVIAIQNARLFEEIQDKSRQLEIASRHKSEFLANMSHELRTPLNAIIGFTRIVMRRSKEILEAKQYENLEKIHASGQHLLALINAILDLSKIEAGHVEVAPAETRLALVLEQCVRTVEPLVKVAMVKEFDGELPQMYVDEEKLRQIVINLLSNAAKFTEQGTIRLKAQAANGAVAIAVTDTGIGIPADKLGMVFEEFEQLDASSTRVHGGTGLGLAIARRLARLMGGDIGVESTLGKGSTFTLTLPLRYRA